MSTPEPTTAARPALSDGQWARLRAYGTERATGAGEVLFRAGEPAGDMILVESGEVEIVRPDTSDAGEVVVARYGPHEFSGELNLLTGQSTYLSARAATPGTVFRVGPPSFRRLMNEDPELSDIVLRALLARREDLRGNAAARTMVIVGHDASAEALALRTYAARQRQPHTWLSADSRAGQALAHVAGAEADDFPLVITPTQVLRRATTHALADHLGLSYRPVAGETLDLVVIGGGPAGLAAAVYGASEGLRTLVLDSGGRRPGGCQFPYRELPRFHLGHQRCGPDRPGGGAGAEVRRAYRQPVRGRLAGAGRPARGCRPAGDRHPARGCRPAGDRHPARDCRPAEHRGRPAAGGAAGRHRDHQPGGRDRHRRQLPFAAAGPVG
ncbi:Crp/Fnr family transcriptional regulator [Streptacidiphilus sp. PAMC 29251]